MIVQTSKLAGPTTMSGPLARRRKAKREQAAKINEETSAIVAKATANYDVSEVVYGADVATGTHTGSPVQPPPSAGFAIPMLPVLLVGGAVVVFLLVKQ